MFVTFWKDIGTTPARVNRFTGEIQINERYWLKMPEFHKKFILEHEKGHFNLPSRDEFKADKYAFNHLAGTEPYSLKNSVYSLSHVLTFKNPEHLQRLIEIVRLALEYDWKKNGNIKAREGLEELNKLINNQNNNTMHIEQRTASRFNYHEPKFGYSNYDDDPFDNGAGKERRQARREKRQEQKDKKKDLKNERLAAKNEIKLARADSKRTKADAKKSLADQGKGGTDWIKDVAGAVGGIFGKKSESDGGSPDAGVGNANNAAPAEAKKFLGMPFGIGIAVVVVAVILIGAVVFFVVRKKSTA